MGKSPDRPQYSVLSRAVDQCGEAVIVTDSDGIIRYVNPAACQHSGHNAEELLGRKARFALPENRGREPYLQMWEALAAGKTWKGSLSEQHRDGSTYPVIAVISPVRDEHGVISRYVCCQRDMTEQSRLRRQFQQAQKMEALGTLVGGIAHDFNNMLAGMGGNLYLARRHVRGNADALEKMDNIERLIGRAAEMIRQLLTFARRDATEMKEMPLTPFIKESTKLLRASVPENIRLDLDFSEAPLPVRADAEQVRQMLANLIDNARDAVTDVHDPRITLRLKPFLADSAFIRAHPYARPGHYARLCVEDNGRGIPRKLMDRIFEPFFTTKHVGKGTGLGLSLVFGSIRTHGGFVTVESRVGQGTALALHFPLRTPDEARTGASATARPHGRGELILLADDEEQVRDTTAAVLESLGYRVLTARDGRDALDVFISRKQDIAVALLDVVMPRMSGPDAAARIRQANPQVKVIFATGYDERDLAGTAGETVLAKPYDIGELGRLLNSLFQDDQA